MSLKCQLSYQSFEVQRKASHRLVTAVSPGVLKLSLNEKRDIY